MRTFSKILSLVLCLAMMVGLCAFGASASDFTDDADIQYKEAVDLMVGLGVIEGMGDGTFNPAGILTRAQAAVIISKMLGEAKGLAGSTPFEDVPSGWWGEPYINYCYNAHIISGYSETSFGPNDTLKGNQFTLMLLRALGYDPENEGISGAGITWSEAQLPIAKLAKQNGLLTGIADYDATADVTRETALQMAFNTLKATLVEYPNSGTTIKTGDVEITTGASAAQKVEATDKSKDFMDVDPNKETQQFAEEYFPGLTLKKNTPDPFGRPGETWSLNGKPLLQAATSEPIATYTTTVTGGKLYTDLGKPTSATVVYMLNGDDATASLDPAFDIASGNTKTIGGPGTLVEAYALEPGKYQIVAVETHVGKVIDHKDAVKDANGDISAKEYITIDVIDGSGISLTDGKFETTDFTANDAKYATKVLFTEAKGVVQSVALPESKVLTATSRTDKSFVADGTTYTYAQYTDGSIVSAENVKEKKELTIYVDSYGYVVSAILPPAIPDYAVVVSAATVAATLDNPKESYQARLLLKDATTMDVTVTLDAKSLIGDIVEYKAAAAPNIGKYELTSLASSNAATALELKTGNVTVKDGGTELFKANANTIFLIASATGYTAYTGISAVPSMNGNAKTTVAFYGSSTYAEYVYISGGTPASDTTTTDIIFVAAAGAQVITDATKGTFYHYNAVVNDEITTIDVQSDDGTTPVVDLTGQITVSVTKDKNGVVTDGKEMVDGTSGYEVGTSTTFKAAADGVIEIDTAHSYTFTDATIVYTVSKIGVITKSSVEAIKDAADGATAYYYAKNGVLVGIFIQL